MDDGSHGIERSHLHLPFGQQKRASYFDPSPTVEVLLVVKFLFQFEYLTACVGRANALVRLRAIVGLREVFHVQFLHPWINNVR